jgi:AraC family transcriptional regulator
MILRNPAAAALGSACAIVHGRARQYEARNVRAPLSLKTVVKGTAEWVTAAGRFELRPGVVLVVNDGEEYSIAVDALQPVETFCVFFAAGFVEDARRSATSSSETLLDRPAGVPVVFRERLHFRGDLLDGMAAAYARRDSDDALDESLYTLGSRMVRASCDVDERTSSLPALRAGTRVELARRVGLALERMHAMLDQPWTVEELARQACLSPFHFHRLFAAFTGQTPHRYLRRLRLERARILLRTGRLPVVEVAQACGFESATSFSAAFSRQFGAPPRTFVNSQD